MASVRDRKMLRQAAAVLDRVAKAPQQRADRFAIQSEAAPEEADEQPQPDQCVSLARRLRALARR